MQPVKTQPPVVLKRCSIVLQLFCSFLLLSLLLLLLLGLLLLLSLLLLLLLVLLGLLGLLLLLLLLLVLLLLCKLDLALFSSWSVAFGCFVSVFFDSQERYQLKEHCWV